MPNTDERWKKNSVHAFQTKYGQEIIDENSVRFLRSHPTPSLHPQPPPPSYPLYTSITSKITNPVILSRGGEKNPDVRSTALAGRQNLLIVLCAGRGSEKEGEGPGWKEPRGGGISSNRCQYALGNVEDSSVRYIQLILVELVGPHAVKKIQEGTRDLQANGKVCG